MGGGSKRGHHEGVDAQGQEQRMRHKGMEGRKRMRAERDETERVR